MSAMTAQSIIPFTFENNEIRVIDENGEQWFVVRDLLAAMKSGTKITDAVESIKQGLGKEFVVDVPLQTAGGVQQIVVTKESGATYLLSRSNTEQGRRLNRFIHVEVLPSIRKTGQFSMPKTPGEALVEMANNFLAHERQIAALSRQQAETAAQVTALVNGEDYWTVVGYGNLIGEKVDTKRSQKLGKIASQICRNNGWHIAKANHQLYGPVGSYPRQAIAQAFDSENP